MLARPRGVHTPDARVRVRAPHERDVQHAGQGDVGDVAPAAGEEAGIFLAKVTVADELHARSPVGAPVAPPRIALVAVSGASAIVADAPAAVADRSDRSIAAASSAAATMF
jgi:hypothetical protein